MQYIKATINAALRPLGIEVRRVEEPRLFPQLYGDLIHELIGSLRELGFSEWPPDERRVPLMMELMGSKVSQAVYLVEYLRKIFALDGDVCEFGVAAGATSALMANEMRATDKRLWLFDSFQGLPKPTEKDRLLHDIYGLGAMERYEGQMACPETMVRQRLQAIGFPESRVRIVPGFIEETIRNAALPERVAFAYVDFDFYEPIQVALEFLSKALTPGGYIVVDDYGYFSAGAQAAVDEFVERNAARFEVVRPYAFAGHFIVLRKTRD